MALLNKGLLVLCFTLCVKSAFSEPEPGSQGGGQGYGVPSGGSGYGGGGHGGGHHQQEQYPPRPYHFAYAVNDHYSGANFGQQEQSDGKTTNGEYRVLLPDGRMQIVTYNADWKNGYNADVKYEGEAKYPEAPKGGWKTGGGGASGYGIGRSSGQGGNAGYSAAAAPQANSFYSAPTGGSSSNYGAPTGGGYSG